MPYNRERFEDLLSAGWDLVIIDEAHRLGGSSEQVARYNWAKRWGRSRLICSCSQRPRIRARRMPSGRLMAFLDPEAFVDETSVRQKNVEPFVIRTEKRHAITAQGTPLFKPRRTQLIPVHWRDANRDQRMLYDAVTDYVRDGYNQRSRRRKPLSDS